MTSGASVDHLERNSSKAQISDLREKINQEEESEDISHPQVFVYVKNSQRSKPC